MNTPLHQAGDLASRDACDLAVWLVVIGIVIGCGWLMVTL